MNTTIATLLQLTASFLMGVQHNPQATLAMQNQAVSAASQVVQLSTQALANIPFAVTPNNAVPPNITDVYNAPYRDTQGDWTRAGQEITIVASSVSFGDLNSDGVDDAIVLTQTTSTSGAPIFALAALLNQGGILFNIANVQLGSQVSIYSHSIVDGQVVIDMQTGTEPRSTYHYELLGNIFRLVQ